MATKNISNIKSPDELTDTLFNFGLKFFDDEDNSRESLTFMYPAYMHSNLLPQQGFKVHLSAIPENAIEILKKVLPVLTKQKYAFKVIASKKMLMMLNCGLFGYSQVGKFITIYLANLERDTHLVKFLDKLIGETSGPKVLFDRQLHPSSVIFYRFGSFNSKMITVNPNGEKIKDLRSPYSAVPAWIKDPFIKKSSVTNRKNDLLFDRYIILKVIRQRSKGGVYLSFDIKNNNVLILKEARRYCDMDETESDAIKRLSWQYQVMQEIEYLSISPSVINYLEDESYAFLIMQYIDGTSLKDRLLIEPDICHIQAIDWFIQIALHIQKLHMKKIYFIDLSPDNIIVNINDGRVALIDFEYSYKDDGEDIGKKAYAGISLFSPDKEMLEYICFHKKFYLIDIFSLGVILLSIFSKNWYKSLFDKELSEVKKSVSSDLCKLLPEFARDLYMNSCFNLQKFNSVSDLISEAYFVREKILMLVN